MLTEVEAFLRQFRTPQGAVTALTLLVGIAGTAGILDTQWTTALKTLLAAALGVILLATHQTATVAVARRAARKAAVKPIT